MKQKYFYIALIISGLIFILVIILSGAIFKAIDFLPMRYAGEIMNQQGNIYDFDLIQQRIDADGHNTPAVQYLYPPFLVAITAPLHAFSDISILIFWICLNAIAIIIGFGILVKKLLPRQSLINILVFSGLLIFFPIWQNLYLGQINPLVFLFLVLGLIAMIKQKDIPSGIYLGIASLLKVFPLVFLGYALFLKKWKIFWSGCITLFTGILLTFILAGWNGLQNWWNYLINILPKIYFGNLEGWEPGNPYAGNLDVLWTTTIYSDAIGIIIKLILISFFIFVFIKYFVKKSRLETKTMWLEISFLCTMMVISSAYNFHHYLIWLIIPMIYLTKIYCKHKQKILLVALIICFIFTAWPPVLTEHMVPEDINKYIFPLINPGFFAVIIILTILIWQYFKKEKTSSHDFHT